MGASEKVHAVEPKVAPQFCPRHSAPTVAVLPGNVPVTSGRRLAADPVATVHQMLLGWHPLTLFRSVL